MRKLLQNSHQPGFTLIELLLYLGIVALILTSIVIFALSITSIGSKSSNQQAVSTTALSVSEAINYQIRNAVDINFSSSNFGVNLASTPGSQLSLKGSGASNPAVISISGGNALLTLGSNPSLSLNPSDTQITNLTFTNLSSGNFSTKNIQYSLTVSATQASGGNVYETVTLEGDAELRSNQ